ncbi:MAG: histidine--tRNA ligase [Cytophagaceae bacterium]|nr:histidine--tRNA ligase [Cytophagaceae bacterium]MBK9934051.1 histidine--tRNA ligase [Cytophagaceae bacterium]MBL0300508.1 histidine--tRNA ligase [Cytophagaceae bacterium]MBL0327442.1 histidine--tRNA ligase [Cytophagaceae bacterium]
MSKPSLARGTRDFGPEIMVKRSFIFEQIKKVYQKYGFLPLETPAIENLSVLMGKYGEEGDQLLFKILNSGDFAKDLTGEDLEKGSKEMLKKVSEKGLKYDLTVPFARYVVMNRHQLALPFKRYQIQPVWRADRPQKGRYREFYQCDADVVGTESLICEAEIVAMLHEVFENLGITEFVIKINNRKILSGITEVIGAKGKETDLCVAIDKIDKIGKEKVEDELQERGFSVENISKLQPLFAITEAGDVNFEELRNWLINSEIGLAGVQELEQIWQLTFALGLKNAKIAFDPSLARGLSYYTGAIFEVKALNVAIGSISGGGRYDNLTGTFGMPGLSGVGISLGVDRIYDVMEELKIFPEHLAHSSTKVMVTNFGEDTLPKSLEILAKLRAENVNAEIYPDTSKMKKQFEYADKKAIPFVLIVGSDEIKKGEYTLKNMLSGEQSSLKIEQIIEKLNV